MNARLAACAAALLAAGCATLPPPAADDATARRRALQALDGWSLTGRVAIAAGAEGFSGALRWRQDGPRAQIELRAPLGARALSILADGDSLSVTDAEGVVRDGEEARRIADGYLGTPLPIAQLRYWLVGTPAPGSPYREAQGADRRLASLEQAGWRVTYARYAAAGAQWLPVRMELTAGDVRLRLSVSDWELAP